MASPGDHKVPVTDSPYRPATLPCLPRAPRATFADARERLDTTLDMTESTEAARSAIGGGGRRRQARVRAADLLADRAALRPAQSPAQLQHRQSVAPEGDRARLAGSARPTGTYLDLCAGTLDVAAELSQASRVPRPHHRRRLRRADVARRGGEGVAGRSCRRSSPTRSSCRSPASSRVGRDRRVRHPQRRESRSRAARGASRARARARDS